MRLSFTCKVLFILGILSAVLLAVIPLHNQLYFYYDQARDAFEAYTIWHGHNFKLLGPPTDIDGLFHGALWYYFLAIPYMLGNNNVLFTGFFILFCSVATIPAVWYLSKQLFKDTKIAVVSTLLYAISPIFQLSSRWVSNPTLSLFVTPLILVFFWRCITKPKLRDFLFLGISYGLLVQSNTAYIFFFLPLPLIYLWFRIRFIVKQLLLFLLGLLVSLSTFLLAEIKFHGRGVRALLTFLHGSSGSGHNWASLPISFYGKFVQFLSLTILPFPGVIIVLTVLAVIVLSIRSPLRKHLQEDRKAITLLRLWIGVLLLFLLFNTGISRSVFVFIPMLLPISLLGGYLIVTIGKRPLFIFAVTLICIFGQILTNISWIQSYVNVFTVQDAMTYASEKKLIDRTYQLADKQPFSINTITVPLYINSTWAYLYEFYGKKKYGYTPTWTGRNQTGNLGELPTTIAPPKTTFLIIEPTQGITPKFIQDEIQDESNRSSLVREEKIGTITLQVRETK